MVRYGETAIVHYHGTLQDGTVFDSTKGKDPLEFVVGSGLVIHGFDEAVARMEPGDETTITIKAKDAFGIYDETKIDEGPMYAIPNAKDIVVGETFYFKTQEDILFPAKVLEINEGIAKIDYNHPLAGKDLTFWINVLEKKAPREAQDGPIKPQTGRN